jgi:antitoxin FitA
MTKAEPETRAMSIRGIPSDVYEDLRVRAAKHGHSIEAEVRDILAAAASQEDETEPWQIATRIQQRFAAIGGLDLDLPPRDQPVREAEFGE